MIYFVNSKSFQIQPILVKHSIVQHSICTGPEFLRIRDSNGNMDDTNKIGLALVKYQDQWGTICGEGWGETDLFCELKNPNWE